MPEEKYKGKLVELVNHLSETTHTVTASALRFLHEIVEHSVAVEKAMLGKDTLVRVGEYAASRIFLTYAEGIRQEAYSLTNEEERTNFIKMEYALTERTIC